MARISVRCGLSTAARSGAVLAGRTASVACAALLAAAWPAAALPIGPEFQVNTYTPGSQVLPSVALDGDGDFMVVWSGDGFSGPFVGRRFTASGVPLGAEFEVDGGYALGTAGPVVALDADGDAVVVWAATSDGDLNEVFARRYASSGAAAGAAFQINTVTLGQQTYPDVAMEDDGDFVVVWGSAPEAFTSTGNIVARRYDSSGAALGSEFQVNTFTAFRRAAVASDSDGDLMVVWPSLRDGDGSGLFAQRFGSDGMAQGGEFQVNTHTNGSQDSAAVAMSGAGDAIVTWQSDQDGSSDGIVARRFSSSGAPLGDEFQVNSYTDSTQYHPAVSADADGDFVIVWTSFPDGDPVGVFGQRYTSSGVAVNGEFLVNTHTPNSQRDASVAVDDDGDFVVAWNSRGQDGPGYSIFAQRFSKLGFLPLPDLKVSDKFTKWVWVFSLLNPNLPLGDPIDPLAFGAVLTLTNPATRERATFALPAGANWRVTRTGTVKYLDRSGANGPCRKLVINANGIVRALCKTTDGSVPFSLDEALQGTLDLSVQIGRSTLWCASTAGGQVRADEGRVGGARSGIFKVSGAPAAGRCP